MNRRNLSGITGIQIVRALRRGGFKVLRVSGSHHVLQRPDEPRSKVVVPVHGAKDLPPGTVASILRQAGLSQEEFRALL